MTHPLRPALVALLAAVSLLALPATVPHAAATEGLTVTGETSYTVDPEARAVHAVVDLSIENIQAPTRTSAGVITNYFFTGYAVAVHGEATDVRASLGDEALSVETEAQDEYLEVTIEFGTRLDYGETFDLRLQYDLVDAGARATSGTRVGAAFAAFFAYAYGENGASVEVTLPPGYRVTTEGDDLRSASNSDGTTLSASGIEDPFDWYAWVAGTRTDSLRSVPVEVPLDGSDEEILVQAWPEDEEWADTVADRLRRGIPMLHELIGLPWPVSGTLEVSEADTRLLGGYAGFYQRGDTIQISSDLEDHVILHEASHAWFNDRQLWRERWLNEGFADEYAARAVAQLGLERIPADPVSRDQDGAFPLNTWTSIEVITTEDARERIEYAYAASWFVVRELVDEIGPSEMREVIVAAKERTLPYGGEDPEEPERLPPGQVDWRNVLDYLEETGGSENASALFRDWVLPEEDSELLAQRAETRAAYEGLIVEGDGWTPPFAVRSAMSTWRFGEAERQIDAAMRVLATRDDVGEAAAAVGAGTTDRLETAYEGSRTDVSAAQRLASQQLETLEAIRAAQAGVARERDAFVTMGLLGENPEAPAAAAVDAFEADDLGGARRAADTAAATLAGAAETGRQRVIVGVAVALLVLLLLALVVLALARRYRARPVVAATADGAANADAPATLPPDSATGVGRADPFRAEERDGP